MSVRCTVLMGEKKIGTRATVKLIYVTRFLNSVAFFFFFGLPDVLPNHFLTFCRYGDSNINLMGKAVVKLTRFCGLSNKMRVCVRFPTVMLFQVSGLILRIRGQTSVGNAEPIFLYLMSLSVSQHCRELDPES